jgi:hypothetical protein
MAYIGIHLYRMRSKVAALDGNGDLLCNRWWRLARTSCSKPSETPARSRSGWSSRPPSAPCVRPSLRSRMSQPYIGPPLADVRPPINLPISRESVDASESPIGRK